MNFSGCRYVLWGNDGLVYSLFLKIKRKPHQTYYITIIASFSSLSILRNRQPKAFHESIYRIMSWNIIKFISNRPNIYTYISSLSTSNSILHPSLHTLFFLQFPLTSWWFINNDDNDSIPNWTFFPRFPHIHIHILACMMCVVLWSSALSQWHHIRPSIAANGSNDDSQIPIILHSHPPKAPFPE